MVKTVLIAALTVSLSYSLLQNYIYYTDIVPEFIWATDTIRLDYKAERKLYLSCKKGVPA